MDRSQRLDALHNSRLYLCTDARAEKGDLREFLHACYSGGADIIQLRDKKLEARAEIQALEVLAEVAAEHGKLFAANDRADVALLVGADVFHVGQGDLTTEQARRVLGPDVLLGRSNNSVAQFAASYADPCLDYAVIGPVWPTPTKPGRPAVGLSVVAECAAVAGGSGIAGRIALGGGSGLAGGSVVAGGMALGGGSAVAGGSVVAGGKPWFAIGGISADTASEVVAAGASRVVVVRALTQAPDPEAAARELRKLL